MGDGNDQPIGMIRDVSESASVQGGKYPEKAKTKVTDLEQTTIGNLISLLAVTPTAKTATRTTSFSWSTRRTTTSA